MSAFAHSEKLFMSTQKCYQDITYIIIFITIVLRMLDIAPSWADCYMLLLTSLRTDLAVVP